VFCAVTPGATCVLHSFFVSLIPYIWNSHIAMQVVACNFTFTVNASSSMPVSFWPPSLAITCNETVVLAHQCLIPSFILLSKSTAFFWSVDVSLSAASTMLSFDGSILTVAFKPLCDPGSFVVQSSINSSGICSHCSSTGFSNISDALFCSACPAGSVPVNRTGCRVCSANTYANQSGSSQCLSCPANYFAAPSRKECLTFDFVEVPPRVIASNSEIQLPCILMLSNVGGKVNLSVAEDITVRVSIFPSEVLSVQVMPAVVQVTLLSNSFACQRAIVKVNTNALKILYEPKYAWVFQVSNCNSSYCSFTSSSDERTVSPYNLSVRIKLASTRYIFMLHSVHTNFISDFTSVTQHHQRVNSIF
jgi:hypothetical protein